jgi:simple sugar transport system substrate-binding protein
MQSRSLRIAVTLAVTVVFAACSPGPTPTPTATPTPTPKPTATPTPTPRPKTYADMVVGFIQTGSESPWRVANTASFTATATAQGIKLNLSDAGGQLANQIDAFHRFNADKTVNVIVLDPLQSFGYDDVLKEARAAGKIVIVEDRSINADPSLYTTRVGADFVAEGQKAAAAMCDLLKGSEKKRVAEISGAVGSSIAIDRARGFRDKMGDCGIPDPTGLGLSQSGNWGVPESKAVMAAFLKKTKDIQGVFAHNDEEAIGAIAAIKDAKLKPGKDIMVVGVDATADGFKYLISGELGADIEYNPNLAPQVYDAALRAMNGDPSLPKFIAAQEGAFYASQGAAALQAVSRPSY